MFSEPGFRRRRRRRFILPIVITVFLLLVWAVGSLRSDSLDATRFYDEVRSVATQQATGIDDFQLMVATMAVDRAQFVAQMDQLEQSVAEGMVRVQLSDVPNDDIPGRVRGTQRIAQRTLESWAAGLAAFEEAALSIVDDPADLTGEARLGEALSLLARGDTLYTVLAEEVEALGVDLALHGTMPAVAYLPVNGATPGFLEALTARLTAATDLVSVTGITIANITTIPEPTGGDQGESVRLPFTDSIDVQVVVANNGNVPELGITVGARLEDVNGQILDNRDVVIDSLESGEEYTADFSDWIVDDDTLYNLRVFVLPSGDGAVAPPPIDYGFFVASRIESTTTTGG